MAKADKRYLKLRRNVYFLNLPIPLNLRPLFLTAQGTQRTHIVETLYTGDLAKANRAKHGRVAYWHAEFNKRGRKSAGTLPNKTEDAREYRELLKDADGLQHAILTSLVTDEAYRIEKTAGEAQARAFANLALTTGLTLCEAFDAWLDGAELSPGTKAKYRNAFDVLLRFMKVTDAAPKDVTRTTALAFVDYLNTKARTPSGEPLKHATKKSYLVGLSSFWTNALEHRELIPMGSNVWHRHKLTGREIAEEDKARAYTDAEMLRLLNGPEVRSSGQTRYPRRTLMELFALLFYTGARLGEICERTLRDVEPIKGGYMLHLRKTKTKTDRSIPVLHPVPVAVLKRRIGNRTKPTAQLFHEFIRGGTGKYLSHYLVRALADYATKVGLDRKLTDTHSARRSFITRTEELRMFPLAAQRYVGHTPKDITWRVYSKGDEEGLREVAKAIKYSPSVERAMRAAIL